MHHGGGDVVLVLGAGEVVGVGEEVAFEAGGLGIEVGDQPGVGVGDAHEVVGASQPRLLEDGRHLVEVRSLGYHHGVDHHVATGDAVIHFDGIGGLVETVLARLERLAAPGIHQQEAGRAADDPGGAQLGGDVPGGGTGAQQHGGAARRLQRQEQDVAQPGDHRRQAQQEQDEEQATQAISLDEKRPSGVSVGRGGRHESPGTTAG
jgi:hypothetical protein